MVTLSPTAALRQRAAKVRREGSEVFNFSVGELDLATPSHIVAAAADAAARPKNHHYGPTAGDERLRQAIADRLTLRAAAPVDGSHVLVTNGAKQSLFNTFKALLERGLLAMAEVLNSCPRQHPLPERDTRSEGHL
ncbi:aminotransferase class I/II-fold pyridoxal phosphate-dependent enzyme [Streptomyces sp. NPDC004629]|uniref:aminotransferase class I/II-fold pyridoxal phosphate-dependent enzyme n=1 Tax=Streptomyces sp. NPDC004629 TaxID=3364705 RepID=UPI0036A2DC96